VRAVRQLAQHYHKSPDLITEEELRQYFLYIKNVKKYSRAASTIAICGIKFFYEKTLNRKFTTLELVRAPRERKSGVARVGPEPQRCPNCGSELILVRAFKARGREPP
jgi:predicted Zn-ribbon and HTH transcriptional regulator